jgi:hypothetical protein
MTIQTFIQNIIPHNPNVQKLVRLSSHQVVRLGGSPMHITCLSGQVWITRAGSLEDTFLASGETFSAVRPGLMVAQALSEATIVVSHTH